MRDLRFVLVVDPLHFVREALKPLPPTWTREEYDTLIEHYPLGGAAVCGPMLLKHKVAAIRRKASFLGIKRVWTKPEPVVEPEPEPEPIAFVQAPRPARVPMSFEDQLAAVRNGAALVEVRPIRRTDPVVTLGGVCW